MSVSQSCPTLCDLMDCSLCSWNSLDENTGVGCHFLLQCIKMKVKLLSRVRLFTTPWTAAFQAPLSMGFSRQEYWSWVPSPSPYMRYTHHIYHIYIYRHTFVTHSIYHTYLCLVYHIYVFYSSRWLHFQLFHFLSCVHSLKVLSILTSPLWQGQVCFIYRLGSFSNI